MQFVWHDHIDSFLESTLTYLEKDEAINNLMLGIALRIQKDPAYYPEFKLMTITNTTGLVLAAVITPPEKIILYSPRSEYQEALNLLVQELTQHQIPIPGVIGPKQLAERFAQLWSQHHSCQIALDMHLRAYELRKVNQSVIGPGYLRVATDADLNFLIDGMINFHFDAKLDAVPDREKYTERAKKALAAGSVYLWEHQGQVVSMAAASRPTLHGITIGMVYTPRELRGHGYATSCVAALSQQLLESGYQFCALFADLANPTSNSIYQKIGYQPVGDFTSYLFVSSH